MTTQTTLRPADRLRSLLRTAGVPARAVTVRASHTGESLTVTVRDPSVSMPIVRSCVGQVEVVRRCSVTGETLLGGNTFVFVRWDDDLERTAREAFVVEALAAHVDSDGCSTVRSYHLVQADRETSAWRDGRCVTKAHGVDEQALRLVSVMVVRDLLERGEGRNLVESKAVAA